MSAFDNLNQNIFGLVALLVSLVALLTTVLQVLQQYFSSAEGYRRCMGCPLLAPSLCAYAFTSAL